MLLSWPLCRGLKDNVGSFLQCMDSRLFILNAGELGNVPLSADNYVTTLLVECLNIYVGLL